MSDSLGVEDEIVAAIRRIMRAVDLHSRRLVEECGLTGPQLATLSVVDRLGPVSAAVIARSVHLSRATVTGILDRLENRGMVTRTRDEHDRRALSVSLTPAGREVLAQAPSLLQDRVRAELARLEDWERSMILANLQRIASMMDAEALSASPLLVTGPVVPEGIVATKQQPEPVTEPVQPTRGGKSPGATRSGTTEELDRDTTSGEPVPTETK